MAEGENRPSLRKILKLAADEAGLIELHPIDHIHEHEFEEIYTKALCEGVVNNAYARVMFVGPGGIGKSSFLCGLMNKSLPVGDSTQLAQSMTVKPTSQLWASASDDPDTCFVELTDEDDVMQIVAMLHLVADEEMTHNFMIGQRAESISDSPDSESDSEMDFSAENGVVDEVVSDIMNKTQWTIPKCEILLHMWDCGGQRIFLVVLPAFLTQRTMFMLMYDARRRLTDPCVSRTYRDGKIINEYHYKQSTHDMMLDWMACIHAMLGAKQSSEKYPRFITVGTHGDDPGVNARKKEIIGELNSACRDKSFIHLHSQSVIIDNTTAGYGEDEDPVYKCVRREICSFAKDLTIPTPVKWVLYRRVFQKAVSKKNSPIMSYEEAVEIGRACNITDEDMPFVLQFYHDLAVFFHYTNVHSLRDHVIANPQWLIDQFAKMLAPEGLEGNQNPSLWELFRKQGILVQPLYEEVWKRSELPAQSLVDLLVHFLLASPISEESKVSKVPGKEYFVSCVLEVYAENDSKARKVVVLEAAPLHMRFNTEYVPPGFFSRLIAALANEPKCDVIFKEGVYFNRITMLYGNPACKIDEIVITSSNTTIEFAVSRTNDRPPQYSPFSLICQELLSLVDKCIAKVLEWLPGIEVTYAFPCDHCQLQKESHFIPFPTNSTTESVLRCEKLQFPELTLHHKFWLSVSEDEQLVVCKASELSEPELQQLTQIVESRGKMEQLAKVLEVSKTLKSLEGSPDASFETLLSWSAEMLRLKINPRAHLIHHLKTIGVNDAATKLSLGRPLISGIGSGSTFISQPTIGAQTTVTETATSAPNLTSLLQDLTPVASDWENIGVYLRIDDGTLLRIKADEPGVIGRLREMLRAWLKRVDPQPTWTDLVGAVNYIDESLADSIRSKHCVK